MSPECHILCMLIIGRRNGMVCFKCVPINIQGHAFQNLPPPHKELISCLYVLAKDFQVHLPWTGWSHSVWTVGDVGDTCKALILYWSIPSRIMCLFAWLPVVLHVINECFLRTWNECNLILGLQDQCSVKARKTAPVTGLSLVLVQVLHHGGQGLPGGTSDPHWPQGPRACGAAAHHPQGICRNAGSSALPQPAAH